MSAKLKPQPTALTTIAERLQFMRDLYADTFRETRKDCQYERQAVNAATEAWRMNLPPLDTRENIQCYIACVAVGLADEIIEADTSRVMLYAAQMALATIGGARG